MNTKKRWLDVSARSRLDERVARGRYDIGLLFETLKTFCFVNVSRLAHMAMVAIVAVLTLHAIYAPSVEWVGHALHLADPSLASVLTLIVVVWLFERVIVVQEELRHPPLTIYPRPRAYRHLAELLGRRGAKKVDLLQVSGMTALRLLRDLAETNPKAEVRLLLLHTATAAAFDTDKQPDHQDRILTTVREVELMEKDYPGFRVEKRYYRTCPTLGAAIVDDDIVSLCWYLTFTDPEKPAVTRVRGHMAPTVTAYGEAALQLLAFAKGQFETLWVTAVASPDGDAGGGAGYSDAK